MSVFVGCGQGPQEVPEAADPAQLALAVGNDGEVCDHDCAADSTDIFRSFVVVDDVILQRFPIRRVLDQLTSAAGTTASTADDIWRQWWSSQRARTGGDPAQHPFCDDNGATINGFPITCPRQEELLAHEVMETHAPVALFNRFDLAPMDGAHCGEYRIVYAMGGDEESAYLRDRARSPEVAQGRNFIIFEGVLPNPTPECGLSGCLPVAQFWQELSNESDVNVRADLLDQFYFEGTCDYPPVVLPEHYGLDCRDGSGYGGACGQIRTNQFIEREWNLREFTLERDCTLPGCELVVQQTTVAQNPHVSTFDSTSAVYPGFEPDFLGQMPLNLPIPDGVNVIAAGTSPRFDAGESVSQFGPLANDYVADAFFDGQIANELVNLGMPGTVTSIDVAERATAQSCGGCHELSNFDDLGNTNGGGANVIWPPSLGFVHVDENSLLSQALLTEFLPHRQSVLKQFLSTTCGTECLGVDQFVVKEVEPSPEPEQELTPVTTFELVDLRTWEEIQPTLPPFDTLSGSLVH